MEAWKDNLDEEKKGRKENYSEKGSKQRRKGIKEGSKYDSL